MHRNPAAFLLLSLLLFFRTASGQDTLKSIEGINASLQKGQVSISEVLSNPGYMPLHSLTAFREVIRQNAKAGKITIVTDSEPGKRITISGMIVDAKGNPLAGAQIYVYQTSNKGWYSDTAAHIHLMGGDRKHARLFGYLKTDAGGKFEFNTIKPVGYPESTLPAHIHIEITFVNGETKVTELLFDDDPRLVGAVRQNSISEGGLISKNSGTDAAPVYSYKITE